ncbi:hypothetical protein RMATCC62417_00837 [Rhizopus microsporus]|nr:hypothetical protein RMATCC62417_00837 [Rhizopus microsporus]
MAEYESRKVIRYSKERMIQLHDSPLVKKPDSLPCLSTWFGEDPGSPILKNILNGSNISRTHSNGVSTDKNILLCPQKANFVSSSYGGFKKNDDNNSMKHTRHKIDSNSNSNNNSNRNPRSFMGEKGLNNNSNSNKSKYMNASPHKRYNNNNSNKRDNHYHSQHHHNQSSSNRMRMDEHNTNNYNERVPEWLDYNPESKDQQQQQQQQQQKEATNDLELWKSTMKKKDGLEESKGFVDKLGQKEAEQAFSFLSLDQKNGFDDFFVKETELLTRRENQTGSRFAKFFAKREGEEDQHQAPAAEPKSISINDLFQGVQQQQPASNNEVHVLSEDDILQSLGAKKNNNNKPAGAGDAIGFNRVLQILSQPKPTIPSPTATAASATTTANSNIAPDNYMIESNSKENQQNMPPVMVSTTTTTNTTGITTATPTAAATTTATSTPVSDVPSATTATAEVKASGNSKPSTPIMSSRFGNNLPTAVLRQMSARSSPSLQTSKSTHTANYSTATTSTAAVARNSPIKQPIHQPIQQYPSVFPYQQPPYSPHQQMMEMFPMNGSMPPPRANGNPEQFLPPHMMMQPPPLPPPNAAQRPMMPPHPFLQGQFHMQRDMMQPMPPYVITNGIPPHQMFNKNQGWERQ